MSASWPDELSSHLRGTLEAFMTAAKTRGYRMDWKETWGEAYHRTLQLLDTASKLAKLWLTEERNIQQLSTSETEPNLEMLDQQLEEFVDSLPESASLLAETDKIDEIIETIKRDPDQRAVFEDLLASIESLLDSFIEEAFAYHFDAPSDDDSTSLLRSFTDAVSSQLQEKSQELIDRSLFEDIDR
jgi:hypothetical protein